MKNTAGTLKNVVVPAKSCSELHFASSPSVLQDVQCIRTTSKNSDSDSILYLVGIWPTKHPCKLVKTQLFLLQQKPKIFLIIFSYIFSIKSK